MKDEGLVRAVVDCVGLETKMRGGTDGKLCEICGLTFVRRPRERAYQFAQRRTCCQTCRGKLSGAQANKSIRRKLAENIDSAAVCQPFYPGLVEGEVITIPQTTPSMHRKHKGARNELGAICWLLDQGYEVFRNVSQHGSIDIVAMRGAEVIYFDVKSELSGIKNGTEEQIEMGVMFLRKRGGSFSIERPLLRTYPDCTICGKSIGIIRRRNKLYCSSACAHIAKRRKLQNAPTEERIVQADAHHEPPDGDCGASERATHTVASKRPTQEGDAP